MARNVSCRVRAATPVSMGSCKRRGTAGLEKGGSCCLVDPCLSVVFCDWLRFYLYIVRIDKAVVEGLNLRKRGVIMAKNPRSGKEKRREKGKEREEYWAEVMKEQAKKEKAEEAKAKREQAKKEKAREEEAKEEEAKEEEAEE